LTPDLEDSFMLGIAGQAGPNPQQYPARLSFGRAGSCLGHFAGKSLHSADWTSVAPKVFGKRRIAGKSCWKALGTWPFPSGG